MSTPRTSAPIVGLTRWMSSFVVVVTPEIVGVRIPGQQFPVGRVRIRRTQCSVLVVPDECTVRSVSVRRSQPARVPAMKTSAAARRTRRDMREFPQPVRLEAADGTAETSRCVSAQ